MTAPPSGIPGSTPAAALAAAEPVVVPPRVWLLSNGDYTTLVSAAGTGASWLGDIALTAGTADRIEDTGGVTVYLRDRDGGLLASLGHAAGCRDGARSEVTGRPGSVEILRVGDGLEARMEICVAPETSLELRRVTLTNVGAVARTIELTACLDVILAREAEYAAHPAFSKLFIQTAFDAGSGAVLARRRPRSRAETHPWLFAALAGEGPLEFETDRARFVGRGRGSMPPLALEGTTPLGATTGDVLDPMIALRRSVRVAPGETARWTFLLGATHDRAAALAAVTRWSDPVLADEAFRGAPIRGAAQRQRLGLGEAEARAAQALLSALYYGRPEWRATPEQLVRLRVERDSSKSLGVRLDGRLMVADAREPEVRRFLPALLGIHRDWLESGFRVRLLILHDDPAQTTRTDGLVSALCTSAISSARLEVVFAIARVVLADGDTVAALGRIEPVDSVFASSGENGFDVAPARVAHSATPAAARLASPVEPLRDFNGCGGFNAEGNEYVIRVAREESGALRLPPRPWVNVIANERFGCIVSETGAGSTWSDNSREHRLTPWFNDPLADPHGEALYVRDDESGVFWSPLAGPAPHANGRYEMRHGFGYSLGRHESEGLAQEVLVFVPRADPVKIVRVRITNRGSRARRLSWFAYQRLVLGGRPEDSARFVITEREGASGALLARNPMADEFAGHVAFASSVAPASARATHVTADRAAFVGEGNDLAAPAALRTSQPLDGRSGAGLDPCFARQIVTEIPAGETIECSFLLGEGRTRAEALALIARYATPQAIEAARVEAVEAWQRLLGSVRVETPVPALDLMLNGWLLYQTLSCRIWGRSALYQSGGAFGYRDQLQDASALTLLAPELLREQILLHAAHQFVEGDAMHWWHPPLGRGLRTRFADDRLWLPLIAAQYIAATGDRDILGQTIPYLTSPPLGAGEDEVFQLPAVSEHSGDLYEHCCRAIDISLALGAHGLPLFGSGDWNDGMNRVGVEGRGESVWMGFFLVTTIDAFATLAESRNDTTRLARYAAHREKLRLALEDSGWDGEWYRRGYYDDGRPLGSAGEDECQIDALAQAWAVLSGVAPRDRAEQAMDAVERQLISAEDGMIRLLAPPFRDAPQDPGYIKGYVAGVRENGGQYTHAAMWVVRAMAELGRNDRAARLLEMLSPLSHSATPEQVARYQVEPYVVAADVYGEPPHVGRGGWTWYTGSAGWMQRVALESVLGFQLEGGDTLVLRPCVPDSWPGFSVTWQVPGGETRYEVSVRNPDSRARGVVSATLDGAPIAVADGAARVSLVRDDRVHRVEVVLG